MSYRTAHRTSATIRQNRACRSTPQFRRPPPQHKHALGMDGRRRDTDAPGCAAGGVVGLNPTLASRAAPGLKESHQISWSLHRYGGDHLVYNSLAFRDRARSSSRKHGAILVFVGFLMRDRRLRAPYPCVRSPWGSTSAPKRSRCLFGRVLVQAYLASVSTRAPQALNECSSA